MTIHHTVITKATKLGFTMAETDNGTESVISVVDTKQSKQTITAPRSPSDVLNAAILMRTFFYEYPALNINWDFTNEERWLITHRSEDDEQTSIIWAPELPTLAEVLELCQDRDLDPEIGADDVEPPTGSIVKEIYKTRYAPFGGTSGDWLAKQLDTFKNKSGRLDIESFIDTCEANGVDVSGAWATEGNRGWQGRARMTGRIKLAVAVAANNLLVIGKSKITPPKAWVKAHLPKKATKATKATKK